MTDLHGDILTALVIIGFYFLPSMVAAGRHHRNGLAISVLNLVGGWTLLGWIVALVWACTSNTERKTNA